MNVMRRLKSIASGRTSISSDPVSACAFFIYLFFIAYLVIYCVLVLIFAIKLKLFTDCDLAWMIIPLDC